MKIGEYLASGYVTSDEVISMIERIPEDATLLWRIYLSLWRI